MQENNIEDYEAKRREVSRFNLTSDIFFGKVMEDKLACQDLIQIMTGDKNLIVKESKSQYSIRNLDTHSVVLDVLAETKNNKLVCIEIHLGEDEDHIRRARFDLGCVDVNFLEKGRAYKQMPDVCMIYITKQDFLRGNRGIYRIEKMVCGTQQMAEDGVSEIFANLSVVPEDEAQASLMRFIKKSDSFFQTEDFPNLADKVTRMKEEREEIDTMCEILEEKRAEGKAEGKAEGIKIGIEIYKKLQKSASVKSILEELNVSEELVREVAREFGISVID